METIWVNAGEVSAIHDIIKLEGWTPISESAVLLVATDEQGLAGFHVLQMIPHPEPLYVRPDLRGTGLASELIKKMVAFMEETGTKGFMCVADTPEIVHACEKLGMRKVTSPVYVR